MAKQIIAINLAEADELDAFVTELLIVMVDSNAQAGSQNARRHHALGNTLNASVPIGQYNYLPATLG
ncbi:hypothetical protein [Pseudomonas sp. MPB03]|jgi:hypothetical protein|uniref:hypothetical protein n=1 Tax=Pseudomonas sp. MPB03 TaxID=3388489 RepID=UPI003984965F